MEIEVSVCITTYNKEKYIEKTVLSALEQVTTFPYEIIISDDQSTDNTVSKIQEIQSSHPQGKRIKLFQNEVNLQVTANMLNAFEKTRGKYIAMLDGDDIWIDTKKLQKQYDFLENHPEYSAVGTDSLEVDIQTGIEKNFSRHSGKDLEINDLLGFKYFQTSTFFFRKKILQPGFPTNINANDRCLFLLAGAFGKVKVMDEVTSKYLHIPESLSNGLNYESVKSDFNMFPYISKFATKLNKVQFHSYLYYTQMTYPSIISKNQFFGSAFKYGFYNLLHEFTWNLPKFYNRIKWTFKTIQQKYKLHKLRKDF